MGVQPEGNRHPQASRHSQAQVESRKYCKAQASDIGPEDRQKQPLRGTGLGRYSTSVTCQVVADHLGRDFCQKQTCCDDCLGHWPKGRAGKITTEAKVLQRASLGHWSRGQADATTKKNWSGTVLLVRYMPSGGGPFWP